MKNNSKKELMIHKWHKKYFKYDLQNYILSFDDGLYSQYEAIPEIIRKFPTIEIFFYVSTNIINRDYDPVREYDEAPIAHEKARNGNFNSYVTYNDLKKLSIYQNVTVGVHGHNHISPRKLSSLPLREQIKIWKNDAKEMIVNSIKMINNKIIKKEPLYYCTPYNEYNDLQIGIIKKSFKLYFKEDLIITGPDRYDIEKKGLMWNYTKQA